MLIVKELTVGSDSGREAVSLFWLNLGADPVPDYIDYVLVWLLLENSIAAKHYEIEIVPKFELYNLRLAHDNIAIAAILGPFSLYVSKGARNWKSSWEYS